MAKLKKITFTNNKEAYEWCNKLLGYLMEPNAKPITISYGFGELRSNEQNSLYWVFLKEAAKFFEDNPLELIKFIENSLDEKFLTDKFLHELCKMRYLKDKTTTDKAKDVFSLMLNKLTEDMREDHKYLLTKQD